METMAERFVRYYVDWTNITPEQHERSGSTFTDFNDYGSARAAADGAEFTYLQWWNCKPCTEEQGVPYPNTRSSFAVIEFDDGTFAMSPSHQLERGERRWITGRPQ